MKKRAVFVLLTQLTQQRNKGRPITGPIRQEKALIFQKEFNEREPDFTAHVGWLDHWKRYRMRPLNIYGKQLLANTEHLLSFKAQFHSLKNY